MVLLKTGVRLRTRLNDLLWRVLLWLADGGSTVIICGAGVAVLVIGVAGAFWLHPIARRQARRQARLRERAVGSEVWQRVADVLNGNASGRYLVGSQAAAGLVSAAHRLLGRDVVSAAHRLRGRDEGAGLGPFDGEATDLLPATTRAVRIYGPIGSGKTVCGRRLISQETDAGRHVTVIRSGRTPYGRAEYEFDSLSSEQFEVIDAESLAAAEARHGLVLRFNRRDDRKHGIVRAPETILIDAGNELGADDLGDLVVRLRDVVANPDNSTRLVVLVNGSDGLCEPPGLFDTELVLPGAAAAFCRFGKPDTLEQVFDRLSRDELTVARLAARVSGGGMVTSRHERQILDGLSESAREYLEPRKTQFWEDAMAATCGFQHGILKSPNGVLSEFRLPVLTDVSLPGGQVGEAGAEVVSSAVG